MTRHREDPRHHIEVQGLDELTPEERDETIEAARSNPDPITRRESLEQELMEMGRSDAGSELGDTEVVAEEPESDA
jgi:hypothetical protein